MLNVFGTPLTLSQVDAALAYYYDHKEEIEATFAEEEKLVAEYDRKRAEYLPLPLVADRFPILFDPWVSRRRIAISLLLREGSRHVE
jgi:hypothetical protein